MNFMNNTLKRKLLGYTAATGAVLAVLPACKKEGGSGTPADSISKNSLNPQNNGDSCLIDFDGDGITDVTIYSYSYAYSYGGYNYSYAYTNIYGRNGSKILSQPGSVNIGTYTYNYLGASRLAEGTSIGPSSSIWSDTGGYGAMNISAYGYNVTAGQFLGADGFVGVQFQAGGSTHYGWVRLSVGNNGKTANISSAGFNPNPDQAINAGE